MSQLRLLLDTTLFATYDYGNTITGRLYQANNDNAFDLTGYTIEVKFLDSGLAQVLGDISGSITPPATNGIFTFSFTNTNRPTVPGYHYVEVNLTKSGVQISGLSQRLYVETSADT